MALWRLGTHTVCWSILTTAVLVYQILPGYICSLISDPAHTDGVLTICSGDVVSLTCTHNNLNSGATRWNIGPPVNCAKTVFYNSADRELCGPFTFRDMSESSQLMIKSVGTFTADASIDGVVVECRDNPGNPSTIIGNISICIVDEPPAPDNITITVSNVTNISWDSITYESCRFTFHVAIRAVNNEVEIDNVTQEAFAVFFNLQPKDYFVSVTARAGSCASNPVIKSFTISANHIEDKISSVWLIPGIVIITVAAVISIIVLVVVVILFVRPKRNYKEHYEVGTKQLEQGEDHCKHHQTPCNIPNIPRRIEPCGEISYESFDHLMKHIQVLQYNLRYDELKECTTSLMDSCNTDLKIMGMLTETTGCTFKGDFDGGIRLTDQALELCNLDTCMNGQILRTRVYYVKSSLYRNYADDKCAQEYLEYAVQESFGITSYFDSSIVAYQQACVLIEHGNEDEAKKYFDKAITDSKSLSDVYLPIIRQKASIGLALAHLGCSKYTHKLECELPGDRTSDQDMESARILLDSTDTEIMPKRTKVEFLIAKSILCYKKNEVDEAIKQVSSAAEICAHYTLEGKMAETANKLLNHLQQKCMPELN